MVEIDRVDRETLFPRKVLQGARKERLRKVEAGNPIRFRLTYGAQDSAVRTSSWGLLLALVAWFAL